MRSRLLALATLLLTAATASRAEEGGSGHYVPGAIASFIDAIPGEPGAVALVAQSVYYSGDAGGSRTFPLGGIAVADIEARVFGENLLGIWEPDFTPFGLDYALGIGVPFLTMKVDGSITGPLGNTLSRTDYDSGLGDLVLIPAYVGWEKDYWKLMGLLTVYAPTAEYRRGELANIGKNYWTFEPTIGVSYLSPKNGRELDVYLGFDFNTKNPKTEYQTGTEMHVEVTAAQHLPFGLGVGANFFYYQQIEGDSGAGAVLGGFKARDLGVGPVLSYIKQWEGKTFAAEFKWLPELDVERRMKGDWLWLKLAFIF
jgi:hypothetical protein